MEKRTKTNVKTVVAIINRPPLAAAHSTGAVDAVSLGDDLDFIGLCGSSNLLFFLYADERRAFLK